MTTHFNKLTPAEAERLAILAEECGETVQAVTKILRHGYVSWENRSTLEREVGNIFAALDLMVEAGDLDEETIGQWADEKIRVLPKYTHHQDWT